VTLRDRFPLVVALDTEFNRHDQGERHHVVAVVGHVYEGDRLVRSLRFFEDDLGRVRCNPFPNGPDVLYVAFAAQAEWASMLPLGWELPRHCIDLFAETRCLRNLALPAAARRRLGIRGNSLIDNCRSFGLNASDPLDKDIWRDRILEGGPWSPGEPPRILDYCESDVTMTGSLYFRIEPLLPPDAALYRGWFTQADADMEDRGLSIDTVARDLLVDNLADLRRRLLLQFDEFGLCDPDSEGIDRDRLVTLMDGRGLHWPRTRTGKPEVKLRTLKARLAGRPELHSIVALAQGLNDLRGLRKLPIGPDGRARAPLWPFSSSTGRNLPGGGFLFQLSRWTRSLIRPTPGRFVCYADWTAQEFAIIAYLSGDPLLMTCYEQPGDPYVNLGSIMGLIPEGSSREHPLRDVIKVVVLGLFYGRGARSIAKATRRPIRFIQAIIDDFWSRCPKAHRWLQSYVDALFLTGHAWTKFGWTVHHHRSTKATSAANFPVQAHGAEMMRWAACLAFDNGVPLCGSVHDAFVSEGRIEDEREIVAAKLACMERGSSIVLGGPIVRAHPVVFRYPERFADKKGWTAWRWIMGTLDPRLAIKPARTA
jgi:hypothetical protein